jgi:hypothetical protein
MVFERASQRGIFGVSAPLFAAAVMVPVHVGDGGEANAQRWTMSMAWMRMPGQMWPSAALSFLRDSHGNCWGISQPVTL